MELNEVLKFVKELKSDPDANWKDIFEHAQKQFELSSADLEELRKALHIGVGEMLGTAQEATKTHLKDLTEYKNEIQAEGDLIMEKRSDKDMIKMYETDLKNGEKVHTMLEKLYEFIDGLDTAARDDIYEFFKLPYEQDLDKSVQAFRSYLYQRIEEEEKISGKKGTMEKESIDPKEVYNDTECPAMIEKTYPLRERASKNSLREDFQKFQDIAKEHGTNVAAIVLNKLLVSHKLPAAIEVEAAESDDLEDCPKCQGKGMIEMDCPVCSGDGVIHKKDAMKKAAGIADNLQQHFLPSNLQQIASFFTYEWDPGSSWKVIETEGKKKLVRMTPPTKSSILSHNNIYRPGSLVTCVAGIYPFPAVVREVLGEQRYKIQSKLDGRISEVGEEYLVSNDLENLFV